MSILPRETSPKQNQAKFYDPQAEAETKRKRALAELLVEKGNTPLKNETAGGMTVARSPWENIAQGAEKYMGEYKLGQADDQQAGHHHNRKEQPGMVFSELCGAGARRHREPDSLARLT